MRIIFFGEDSFSNVVLQSLIDKGHKVILVLSPFYNNKIYKRIENTCIRERIKYIRISNLKDNNFINKLKELAPDLIVIAHFEKLLQKEIIDIPKKGCINLHPSLLPNYRGMSPQHWPIINGDSQTGISVHYVDETADTGDIIIQRKVNISSNIYVSDLQLEFLKHYKTIVVEAIELINKPDFAPIAQSHYEGSYFGKLKKCQCMIDLKKSCKEIMNLIRGVSKPYFGAFIDNLIIWKAHKANSLECEKILSSKKIGLGYSQNLGYFLNLKDGIIIIDKYEEINKNEKPNNKNSERNSPRI